MAVRPEWLRALLQSLACDDHGVAAYRRGQGAFPAVV